MARISIGSANLFSKETYQQYLEGRKTIGNERYRKPDETIFDALLSEDADFTKDENAEEIINALDRAGKIHGI
jgi:hypothetical protein